MSKQSVNVETGIEIWEGLPGSGKSYGAVKKLVQAIIDTRRPVYTNLPLRTRVLKKHLVNQGGDPLLARYIRPLTREHFHRFVIRNQQLSDYREQRRPEGIPDWKIEDQFFEQHGSHIEHGPDANWICEGSVLILDEFHRWADQRKQQMEDPAYLTYATMHRHHLHLILILTQDAMQVSLPWRRNCHQIIHCTDKRRLPFMFGIRVPLTAFAYEYYPAEYADLKSSKVKPKPTRTVVEVPRFTGGVIWRLYDSFTHLGGYRSLQRKLDAARARIEEGAREGLETQAKLEDDSVFKLIGKIGFGTVVLLVLGASIVGAAVLLSGDSAPEEAEADARLRDDGRPVQQRAPITRSPSVTAVGQNYAIANGVMVKQGGQLGPWTLEGADIETGRTLWSMDGRSVDVPIGVRTADESSGIRQSAISARALLGRQAPNTDR